MLLLTKPSAWMGMLGFAFGAVLVIQTGAQLPQPTPPLTLPSNTFDRGIGAAGIIESRHQNITIGVPTSGLVTKVFVDVWDQVKPGDPLLQLDDRDLRAQLGSDEALVNFKKQALELKHEQYTRMASVTEKGAVSEGDLKTKSNEMAMSDADLKVSEAAVTHTKALLDRLTVRAPSAGTILKTNIRAGEYIEASSAQALILLGDIKDVWVRADIDEQVAPRVRPGQPAVGYLKGDAAHGIPMDFVRIEPYVTPKVSLTGDSTERVDTRVLQVIYQFHNPTDRRIYIGQQIDVFIKDTP